MANIAYNGDFFSRFAGPDALIHGLLSRVNEFLHVGVHLADAYHDGIVPVDPVLIAGDIDVEAVTFFQWSHIRNAVTAKINTKREGTELRSRWCTPIWGNA